MHTLGFKSLIETHSYLSHLWGNNDHDMTSYRANSLQPANAPSHQPLPYSNKIVATENMTGHKSNAFVQVGKYNDVQRGASDKSGGLCALPCETYPR